MSSETSKPVIIAARQPDVEDPWLSKLRQQLLLLVSLRCAALVIDFGNQTMFYRGADGEWLSGTYPGDGLLDVIKSVAPPDPANGIGRLGLAFDAATLPLDAKFSGNECEISLSDTREIDDSLVIAASDLLQAQWQESSRDTTSHMEVGATSPIVRHRRAELATPRGSGNGPAIIALGVVAILAAAFALLLYMLAGGD